MATLDFGEILRQAREQSGEDLVAVARKIRIRPDILEKIEASDLAAMPPRGYSRNMINAYARYLGLDASPIVEMYLKAQYGDQVSRARSSFKPGGHDSSSNQGHEGHHEHGHQVHAQHEQEHRSSSAAHDDHRLAHQGAAPSHHRLDEDHHEEPRGLEKRSQHDARMEQRPGVGTTSRLGAVHVGSYNAYGQGLYERRNGRASEEESTHHYSERLRNREAARSLDSSYESGAHSRHSTHRARHSTMPGEHLTNLYAAPRNLVSRNASSLRDKLPFVVAGLVVLLVLVVIVVTVNSFANRAATQQPESTPMNITGMPESGQTGEGDASSAEASKAQQQKKKEAVAPTKTVVAYTVADGESAYVEVYMPATGDDRKCLVMDTKSGGTTETFDVTDSIEIRTSNPESLSITKDGKKMKLSADESGVAVVTVKFSDVLKKWKKAHADADEPSTEESGTNAADVSDESGVADDSSDGEDATGAEDVVDDGSTDAITVDVISDDGSVE